MTHVIICGSSMDTWLGLPPPTEPHCDAGHRRILMRWRVRRNGWWCRHCGRVMSESFNRSAPHNDWWRQRRDSLDARMICEEAVIWLSIET